MRSFPLGFFQQMPVIRVLDLSNNVNLIELPLEICRLESLEYLNLGIMRIKKLPVELKNLTNLRCLILDCVNRFLLIPPNVICCLSNLRMFNMIIDSIGIEEYEVNLEAFMVSLMEELECLQRSSEMSINLHTASAVQKFLTSHKLQKCLQVVLVHHCQDLKEVELPLSTLQRLRTLHFKCCSDLKHVRINMGNMEEKQGFFGSGHLANSNFINLVHIEISGCQIPGFDMAHLCSRP